MTDFRTVPIGDLPLRTLREVSAMVEDVVRAGDNYGAAVDAVIHSPRTPFFGVFLVGLALLLLVAESLDAR